MNLNNIVLTNVQASPYFRVELAQHNCVEELIDQIYYKVRGVGAGGVVSSAFCILYKLFTIKPTKSQLKLFLNHRDSPYIRGIGFIYCLHPHDLWKWFEPYLDDEEVRLNY
ncbi:hypothetical protein HZS_997 [Henneguya salminicola]|nr:hypothetical protein HZS_997 [Henneguya salminicola]